MLIQLDFSFYNEILVLEKVKSMRHTDCPNENEVRESKVVPQGKYSHVEHLGVDNSATLICNFFQFALDLLKFIESHEQISLS